MPCNGNYFDFWGIGVPKSSPTARITEFGDVTNAFVVHIKNGEYRDAIFSGTFEILDRNNIWLKKNKKERLLCRVYWYCHRPPTQFPSIFVEEGNFEFEENYTGKVVRNIGT